MFLYQPYEEMRDSPELGCYRTFGIRAYRVDGQARVPLDSVSDVSPDEAFTARLAALYTRVQLDPIHLLDVILDAI